MSGFGLVARLENDRHKSLIYQIDSTFQDVEQWSYDREFDRFVHDAGMWLKLYHESQYDISLLVSVGDLRPFIYSSGKRTAFKYMVQRCLETEVKETIEAVGVIVALLEE